ncbi:MAG TPA: hypothetical protein VFR44_13735, partial [Actinomycetota bacterium]|nr:hypothetical protein [Actinomycetota bacterium]
GAPFMSELRRRRFVDVVFIDALFTIAAGSFLYWHDWHTHPSFGDWIGTDFGVALTVGALLAISAIIVAGLVTRPTIGRLVSLGKQVAESGGTPMPVLAARIGSLQRRLVVAERASFALAVLAVAAMASARYI